MAITGIKLNVASLSHIGDWHSVAIVFKKQTAKWRRANQFDVEGLSVLTIECLRTKIGVVTY